MTEKLQNNQHNFFYNLKLNKTKIQLFLATHKISVQPALNSKLAANETCDPGSKIKLSWETGKCKREEVFQSRE